ncbi:phage holin family protein [Bombilactobacillus folatiphilus]|uniref:Phage holin family protein n=1 Tax=Bombilactobacillus folatiphilus TaxID=2923362 RepID=A0ABY4P7W6_9LACO|nr:phage holin family protein [Bombilactobacillus folatiphilus]UQS81686.1 phage holin family protein [Bombilactobacillus folatiphilus]
MKIIYQTLINTLLFMAIARLLPTIFYLDDWLTAVIAGFVLVLLNMTIKPILKIVSFPITFLTFGLFSIVINALTLEIVAALLSGFVFYGFGAAMIVAIIMSIANAFVGYHVLRK